MRLTILAAWHELIDPERPILLHIVKPTPQNFNTESTLLHVLIERNGHPPTHSAGVTVVCHDHAHASLYHFAISSARQIAAQSVLREARLQDLCSLRFCVVSYDNVPLRDDILDEFESGFVSPSRRLVLVRMPHSGRLRLLPEDD